MIILNIVIALSILFLLVFLYSACVVSSRCAREEEKRDEYFRNV